MNLASLFFTCDTRHIKGAEGTERAEGPEGTEGTEGAEGSEGTEGTEGAELTLSAHQSPLSWISLAFSRAAFADASACSASARELLADCDHV